LAERDRDATAQQPSAAELLRAALDKIVFFEWRVSELAGEVAAAHRRCAAAEQARAEAEDEARASAAQAKSARMQCAEMEAEQARISALLSNPAQDRAAADARALELERRRCAALAAQMDQARGELARSRAERERWLTEMIAQARTGEEAPAALAQFISELRGEVIALRDHRTRCEAALTGAGIAAPAFEPSDPPPSAVQTPEPVDEGRRMWAEGRLAAAPPPRAPLALPPEASGSAAARALADQCLRSLASPDSARREQAARHLAAAPLPAAAPAVASALSAETAPKARAQLVKALAACGGESAADIVGRLQEQGEAPLVRLAALDALCAMPRRARGAIEMAARDAAAAVRRRAAALAVAEGFDDLAARFAADEDGSVRGALAAARSEAPAAAPKPQAPAPIAKVDAPAPLPARPRDPVRAALQRLVLEGGSR
jgi:predicted  nucleic acid-binding Zn-ribbon protein